MVRASGGLAVAVLAASLSGCGQTGPNAGLTPAEAGLVALMTDYYAELEVYWSRLSEYETRAARQAAIDAGEFKNPSAEYIPRLLEFEERHRGTEVGLNALRHVYCEAGRGGWTEDPRHAGAREAASRMRHYLGSPLLPFVVRHATCDSLTSEPVVRQATADLVEQPGLPSASRNAIRLLLAQQALHLNDWLPGLTERVAKLRSGEIEPEWAEELDYGETELRGLPSIEEASAAADAAIETLEELSAGEVAGPRYRREGVDERWYVVRVIPLTEDEHRPTIPERATALLFKHRYLIEDALAPELSVTLLDGEAWRLDDHRGKVVVIQFSFTGCGPCARMYPDLKSIAEEYGDGVEVLTLMRDESPVDAIKGVSDGKLTWSVAHDGDPGKVTTRWSVSGFPTTYVVAPDGRIAATDTRGDHLKELVAKLAADAS